MEIKLEKIPTSLEELRKEMEGKKEQEKPEGIQEQLDIFKEQEKIKTAVNEINSKYPFAWVKYDKVKIDKEGNFFVGNQSLEEYAESESFFNGPEKKIR